MPGIYSLPPTKAIVLAKNVKNGLQLPQAALVAIQAEGMN
jgi:hypothetical protein